MTTWSISGRWSSTNRSRHWLHRTPWGMLWHVAPNHYSQILLRWSLHRSHTPTRLIGLRWGEFGGQQTVRYPVERGSWIRDRALKDMSVCVQHLCLGTGFMSKWRLHECQDSSITLPPLARLHHIQVSWFVSTWSTLSVWTMLQLRTDANYFVPFNLSYFSTSDTLRGHNRIKKRVESFGDVIT